jgi:hypothetical protein
MPNNLENHIQKAGAILEITSKLPQIRDVPFAHLLNQILNALHRIPQQADIEKRWIAKTYYQAVVIYVTFSLSCGMEIHTLKNLTMNNNHLVHLILLFAIISEEYSK